MKKGAMFKQVAGTNTDRPRSGRQSIRGRISAPIPISDPLDPTQLPVSSPITSIDIARHPPEGDDDIPKRQSPPRARAVSKDPEAPIRRSMLDIDSGSPAGAARYKTPESALYPGPSDTVTPSSRPAASPMAAQPKRSLAVETPRPGPSPSSGSLVPSTSASATGSGVSTALRQATNRSSTLRYSQVSGNSEAGQSGHSNSSNPQRKQSTIRGAFSKLFGRRKKAQSEPAPNPAAVGRERTPQHRSVHSDPTILSRTAGKQKQRTSSLPISEYDRALRSHSVGANDLTSVAASHSFQADRDSDVESTRRRAGTATNHMLFSGQRRPGGAGAGDVFGGGGEFGGLSPRPVSAHGRGNSHHRISAAGLIIGGGADNSSHGHGIGLGLGYDHDTAAGGNQTGAYSADDIGRAITSDVQGGTEFGHRRRSRSLSGIKDISGDQGFSRRRSDEIRYWRESYDPAFLSPVSSTQYVDAEDEHTSDADDDRVGQIEQRERETGHVDVEAVGTPKTPPEDHYAEEDKDMPAMSLSMQSLPETPSEPQDPRQPKTPRTPPQPFPFGNLTNIGVYSGMKITQAATLDSRLGVLENRMQRIERLVDQLCHAAPSFNGPSAATPPTYQMPRPAPNSTESSPGVSSEPALPRAFVASDVETNSFSPHAANGGATSAVSSSYYSSSSHHSGYSDSADMPSHMSFGDGQTYVGSLYPPSSSATQSLSIAAPSTKYYTTDTLAPSGSIRPTSTSTVRGVTSLPAIGSPGSTASTADLVAQLESERAVRQKLEAQVKKLNDRVNTLSTTMFAMVRDPVPKAKTSREPLAALSMTNVRDRAPTTTGSRPAGSKSENASPPIGKGYEPETESEDFQTPLEEVRSLQMSEADYNNYSDYDGATDDTSWQEFRGGNKVDESQDRKKAPRTLSLGQLTLGKGTVRS